MNDLISRQAAIDAIVNTVSEVGNHDNSEVARYGATFRQHEILDIIESLSPTQPRKGKWIEHDDNWANVYYECSVCKEPFVLIDGTPAENLYNFCPNCGCRMKEGDSE